MVQQTSVLFENQEAETTMLKLLEDIQLFLDAIIEPTHLLGILRLFHPRVCKKMDFCLINYIVTALTKAYQQT